MTRFRARNSAVGRRRRGGDSVVGRGGGGGGGGRARPGRGDAGEHLSQHLEHVQLSRVLGFPATVFGLQPLLLHAVEAVFGLRALLQELLHEFLHGEVCAPLPRPFSRSG